jgi:hypothetical protein
MEIINRQIIHDTPIGEVVKTSKMSFHGSQQQVSLNSWGHLVFRSIDPGEEKLIVFDFGETKEIVKFFRKLKDVEVPF